MRDPKKRPRNRPPEETPDTPRTHPGHTPEETPDTPPGHNNKIQ